VADEDRMGQAEPGQAGMTLEEREGCLYTALGAAVLFLLIWIAYRLIEATIQPHRVCKVYDRDDQPLEPQGQSVSNQDRKSK
jgi:hypothetical protein